MEDTIKLNGILSAIIEVDISNIEIDQHYFSFDYKIKKNHRLIEEGEYSSDHSWQEDLENFKELLLDGEAVKLALEQID